MRHLMKEYGHLAVMCVCLVCSAVLLWSVTTDRPLVAIAQEHIPVLRVQAAGEHDIEEDPMETAETLSDTARGFLLTEAYLESRLAGFLPDSFPASDIDAELEDGLVELDFSMERSALRRYFKEQGVRLGAAESLLLQMLPGKLSAEADFALSADENGLHLQPVKLELGDKSFDLSALPEDGFSAIDEGLNALLRDAGVQFSTAEFTEEGLLLKQA